MKKTTHQLLALEINPKLIGALFTEQVGVTLRIFCFYTNGDTSQFDIPADGNLECLHNIFDSLNMEKTCTSIILNEVVHGRVYARAEDEHWLYTILTAPTSALPPFNADILEFPWQVIWESQEAQILHYRNLEGTQHCYAIRGRISEADSSRLIKASNALSNPVSMRRKEPNRWLYLNLAIALVVIGIIIGFTIYYTNLRHPPTDRIRPVAVSGISTNTPAAPARAVFILFNRQISGPYPVSVIAEMNAKGLIPAGMMYRPENSTEWSEISNLNLTKPGP